MARPISGMKTLLAAMATEPLCETKAADGSHYHLAGGRSVRHEVVRKLMARGRLIPNDDGLFAGASQTWRAV